MPGWQRVWSQLTDVLTVKGYLPSVGAQELMKAGSHLVHVFHHLHGSPNDLEKTGRVGRGPPEPLYLSCQVDQNSRHKVTPSSGWTDVCQI